MLFRSLEMLFRSLEILFRLNNLAGTEPLICHLIYWNMKTISKVAVILRAPEPRLDFHLRVLRWRPGFNIQIANTETKYFV